MRSNHVAEAIKLARQKAGMSGAEVAAAVDVSRQFIHEVERSKRRLTQDKIALLPDGIRQPVLAARIREVEEELAALRREL